jgi:hypothetical protein
MIERISLQRYELEVAADLTVSLTKLLQDNCKGLAVENVGPEIFSKLIEAVYGKNLPILAASTLSPKFQADGSPWGHRPGAVNMVNL